MYSCVFLICVVAHATLSAKQEDFTVAVVEYEPYISSSPSDTLSTNTRNYLKILDSILYDLDLLVYPEGTLTPSLAYDGKVLMDHYSTYVRLNDNPCNDKRHHEDYIAQISCGAREHNTYIVVNTVERDLCTTSTTANCQKYRHNFYNTDIVFDRSGKIVAKYRKYNLFGEKQMDRPLDPQVTTFMMEPNKVEFGVVTCFDILFKSPAQDLVTVKNVTHVIYPTLWYSELPFLTALQVQQMWAHVHNVNLYASGGNNPKIGTGGSGIYHGSDGPLTSDMLPTGGWRILTNKYRGATDSPDDLSRELDDFYLMREDLTAYNSTPIDLTFNNIDHRLCHGTLCCSFSLTQHQTPSPAKKNRYTYHFVAYAGPRSFSGLYSLGIEVCAIVACLDSSIGSCGRRFGNFDSIAWPTTFESIEVEAEFGRSNRTQYPNSLLSSLRPVETADTEWRSGGVTTRFKLLRGQDRLLTFGIFGRDFTVYSEL